MSCVLCGDNNFGVISEKDSKNKSTLMVYMCKTCSMVSQNPVPTEEELQQYYAEYYRQDYKQAYEPKLKHVYRAGNLAINRLGFLSKNNITSGMLLDVGAGGGEFTYISSQLGFNSAGIEPSIGYSNYAKAFYQANVKTGELADIDDKFDIITMFHVMEHIPCPIKTFEKLYGLLNDNGLLFIEVPNIETHEQSPDNTFFKAHIHYFSKVSLICSASQYFSVIDAENTGNLRVLLKKNKTIKELKLPTKVQVSETQKILEEKGWLSYITKGKGYKKVFNRMKVIIQDKQLAKINAKDLLDSIVKKYIPN